MDLFICLFVGYVLERVDNNRHLSINPKQNYNVHKILQSKDSGMEGSITQSVQKL